MAVNGTIQLAYQDTAWFAANPTIVLLEGQHVYLSDGADEFLSAYVVGDGVTELQNLPWKGLKVTKTSDLTNDGEDGVNPFISLNDLPSNIVLYPTNVASSIPTYFKAVDSITDPDYNTTAVDISTGAITGTAQLISSLSAPVGLIVGNPGVFNITTIGNIRRVSGTGTATFYFEVYKRTSGGTETLIGTSLDTLAPTSATYVEFSATAIWNDGIFTATDLTVIKFYANRVSGGSNPTYEFQFGGTTPVRTLVPVPLNVTNTIQDLQSVTNEGATTTNPIVSPNFETISGFAALGDSGLNVFQGNGIDNLFNVDNNTDTVTYKDKEIAVIEAAQTTGVALTFLTDSFYGTVGTPETGNITFDLTNAKRGVMNTIIHNSGTAPPLTGAHEMKSSLGYSLSVLNYIFVWFDGTDINYRIDQRA